MKLVFAILLVLCSVTSLFSQEFMRNSTVHFKDSSIVRGDFYYYATLDQSVTLIDSMGNKQVFDLALIDYIQGKVDLYRVLDFNGKPTLLDAVMEGEKVSLYKTNYNEDIQFYVLKENKVHWLEGGELEFEKNGQRYRKKNIKYKGTLTYLFNDNQEVVNKIDEISYFESSITPIIIAYNDGRISFLKTKELERQNRVPKLKIFAQYSNQVNFVELIDLGDQGVRTFQIGAQYVISEESRHSFKFGFDYNQYELDNGKDAEWWNFSTGYYYNSLRMPNSNVYFGLRLMDIYWTNGFYDEKLHIYARIAPLVGYELHISRKLDLYVEINHLFTITNIPKNFSVGLTYDL